MGETPNDNEALFGIIDYITFALMLLVSIAIGIYMSFKGNKSPEDFLMGNRDFGVVPVSMSLLTSFVSAISLLGYSSETYAFGIEMYLYFVGTTAGIWVASVVCLPVLYPLKLTSVNEYIVLRFKSEALRKFILLSNVIQSILYMGICLYAPTLALSTVTPISSITYIFILGVVVTAYSTLGGIRAVIWTDVFQLSVMLIGLFVVFVAGIINAGGLKYVYETALQGGRITNFHTTLSIYERHTIFNTFFFGLFLFSCTYGTSQINVQRLCAVRSLQDGKKILFLNAIGMLVMFILVMGQGVIAYVAYNGCDPLMTGAIERKEEIIPYFIVDRLSYLIGLPGLFVATLIGGALSSLSSVISAIVAMIWKDFFCEFNYFSKMKPQTASLYNKLFTSCLGVIIIGSALFASNAESLVEFTMTMSSVFSGGIYAIFLIGFLFPMVNVKGCFTGLIISSIFIGWISVGSIFYGKSTDPLPFSADNCTNNELFPQMLNSSIGPSYDHDVNNEYFSYLYHISYTLYFVIATTSCLLISFITSYFTGNTNPKEVNPKYISPFMRKFYWTKDELKSWEKLYQVGNRVGNEENEENIEKLSTNLNSNLSLEDQSVLPLTFKTI